MSAAILADDAPHLLVVDDDSRIRTLLRRFLVDNGYRVTIAEDGRDARQKLEGLAFDLLVLDVMMPGESGLDLAEALRTRSDVPILMLTARADAVDRIRGLEIGADDYLAKPFEPRELLLRIGNVLKRRAQPQTGPEEVRFGLFAFRVGLDPGGHGRKCVRWYPARGHGVAGGVSPAVWRLYGFTGGWC